jgi:hypothetical protein
MSEISFHNKKLGMSAKWEYGGYSGSVTVGFLDEWEPPCVDWDDFPDEEDDTSLIEAKVLDAAWEELRRSSKPTHT